MENGGGNRKTRIDKKVDVKPTVSVEFKKQFHTFSYLCDMTVKDAAELLIVDGLVSKVIIDDMCKWFRRNYLYKNTVAVGDPERPKLKIRIEGESDQITTRLKRDDYDRLKDIAYALDVTPTSAAGILIKVTLSNIEFMQRFAQGHLLHLSDERKKKIDIFLNKLWGL